MPRTTAFALAALMIPPAGSVSQAETSGLRRQYLYDNVLHRHVRDGRVDYAALKQDPELGKYLEEMADVSVDDLRSELSRKSFWINVYNACVLKAIAEAYPVGRANQVPGLFHQSRWKIAGKKYSLQQMLDDVLRAFGDPRIHFALCNGAVSAPRLRSRSYGAYDLDKQLDEATREYLRAEGNVRLDRINQKLDLPMLFHWHAKDFAPKGAAEFVGRYLSGRRNQRLLASRRMKVEYHAYDWRLNDKEPAKAEPDDDRTQTREDGTKVFRWRIEDTKDEGKKDADDKGK